MSSRKRRRPGFWSFDDMFDYIRDMMEEMFEEAFSYPEDLVRSKTIRTPYGVKKIKEIDSEKVVVVRKID